MNDGCTGQAYWAFALIAHNLLIFPLINDTDFALRNHASPTLRPFNWGDD